MVVLFGRAVMVTRLLSTYTPPPVTVPRLVSLLVTMTVRQTVSGVGGRVLTVTLILSMLHSTCTPRQRKANATGWLNTATGTSVSVLT